MTNQEDLVRHYRWLRQYGLNDSHSGNGSIRDGKKFWITPTGCCADTLASEDLVSCHTTEGCLGQGASLDTPLHMAVYQTNPKARAVLHSHGPYAVAMTLDGKAFAPKDFEGQLYFSRVPVVTIPYEQYVDESPRLVAELLTKSPIAIVRGHGIYAWGDTLNLAYKWVCSLELSAKTAFIAQQAQKT
jgi:L-fuculose-phosphate aldolase